MTSPNPSELFSPFLPTTVNFPEEEDRVRTFFVDKLSTYADVINDKKIGMYVQDVENLNGNKHFYDSTAKTRNGYQAVLRFTTFVSGTFPLPIQNVGPQFRLFDSWGAASKPCTAIGAGNGDYFTFLNQGSSNISFTMSDLSVTITAAGPMAAYNGFIVLEYIHDGS